MSARPTTRRDLGEGAWLELYAGLVESHLEAMEALQRELELGVEEYRIFGRTVTSPRLVAYHGDAHAAYAYSGVMHEPAPWTPTLTKLKAQVEETSGLRFHAVLANLYRDGRDSMGWHADAEPEMGPSPEDRWIASLSLGSPRRFVLKHRERGERVVLELGRGDLLVMRGTTQTHWRHALPKTAKQVGPRLNLTFRHLVGAAAEG